MGDRGAARRLVAAAGVPVTPGTEPLTDHAEAIAAAERMGFPVLIKAVAGGGGKGIRLVQDQGAMEGALRVASSEAASAFGDGAVYVEKLLEPARHVEVQVLADDHGSVVSLGERECSIQRRHQKLIEESPSTQVTAEMRERGGKQLSAALSKIGYVNAGTVEFLMDEERKLHFIEMNTRIQVEHPVTEMVTDIDLVKSQILLAAGAPLSEIAEGEVCLKGHSI